MSKFILQAPYQPAGSQPDAIRSLLKKRPCRSALLGVTGSGKTFTMANVIAACNKPTLIISPNKTLAAQLYEEFYQFFPHNKVCYFVSYYDYYQPESYMPAQDIYIPKETKVNREIERLRIEATASLLSRQDVIIITSVSCIYSLGNPTDYRTLALSLCPGDSIGRTELINKLIHIQYERNDIERLAGTFQVCGNVIEVQIPYFQHKLRIELHGSKIETMRWVNSKNNTVIEESKNCTIFPAKHFVTTDDKKHAARASIETELREWGPTLANPAYQDRLTKRVNHDLELLEQIGYCSGIENYSVHFDGRNAGQPPYCLLDFFPEDFLLMVDESHIALPQLRGMYSGDKSRKQSLVDFGFRLPSALDNRPLRFDEFEKYLKDVIYVSATPGDYELTHSDHVVEQLIRPTGLVDPAIEIKPRKGQIDSLVDQINKTTKKGYRSLVTVMSKQMAQELAQHLEEKQVKACYLHSEIKTPERTDIIYKLRSGIFDCLVGVNLLREGLDLPEVALVAIMDADIESFLRDKRSLIQTIGRAARNTHSRVIFYADKITQSMKEAMDETNRRRNLQITHNEKNDITPTTVTREVTKTISGIQEKIRAASKKIASKPAGKKRTIGNLQELQQKAIDLERHMHEAADKLDFDTAISFRDQWRLIQEQIGSF